MNDGRFDGWSAADLAARCQLPRVVLPDSVESTMDVGHALAAEGTPAGTLVLTDRQTMGRGRNGRAWTSAPGDSLTLTLIERPSDHHAVAVLSLRLGITLASCLQPFAAGPLSLKWPNDIVENGGKLLGILVEARWRELQPDWVAIGIGLNVRRPVLQGAVGLAEGAPRVEILAALVSAMRQAAALSGELTAEEQEAFAARDCARGRRIVEPVRGMVAGIAPNGALLVETDSGLVACVTGSLVFAEA